MGESYELIRNCIYCGEKEEDVWYAPTCSSFGFKCKKCGKYNFITMDLKVKKIEEVTFEDIYHALSNASTMMTNKQIKSMAKEFHKELKKEVQSE